MSNRDLIVIGAIAAVVNLVTALLIRRDCEHDLNLRSAFLHLMGDVFSTVGAAVAGVISSSPAGTGSTRWSAC